MIAMMYVLGAQVGELRRAKRSDYTREPGATIHLARGRDRRTLPLVPLLVELMDEYLADYPLLPADGPLFPSTRGGWQGSSRSLILDLESRANALGIGFRVGTLDLREACKDHMRRRGVPRQTLQALLGVKTPNETHLFGHKPRLKATGS